MKQMEVTDELLYQYMPIADEMDLDALEAEIADEEIVLSKKFERRMKRLMWKEEHKWVAGFGKFMARVAVVMLCVLGVSLAVTMSVDAYRSKFFQTVQEIWEDSVVHTYDVGEEGQEFVPHEPSYIPEGYAEVYRVETDEALNVEYQYHNSYLCWDQYKIKDGTWNIMDIEYKEQIIREINDGYVIFNLYENDIVRAYYEKEQYVYVISSEAISLEEICRMFESIN